MRVEHKEGYEAWRVTTASQDSDQAFLVESVEKIADYAEEFKDKNNLSAIESLRQGYAQYQDEVGVLHPNIMARILAVFAIWWEYGEEVVKETTPFETSIVMFAVLEYQRELQSFGDGQSDGEAAGDDSAEGSRVPEEAPDSPDNSD